MQNETNSERKPHLVLCQKGHLLFQMAGIFRCFIIPYLDAMKCHKGIYNITCIRHNEGIVYVRIGRRIWNKLAANMLGMVGKKTTNRIENVTFSSEMPSLC